TGKPVDKLANESYQQARKGIDGQGYLTTRGIRLQENQDVCQAIVKYTYFNFDKSWVQPQTYPFFGTTGQELTTEQHLRPEWQRVYAQQSFEFRSTTANPQPGTSVTTETNAKVMRITTTTDIRAPAPACPAMKELTWSFWVNFVNNTATLQSVLLFSYAESQAWVSATVSNNLTPIPGAAEALQKALNDAQTAEATATKARQE